MPRGRRHVVVAAPPAVQAPVDLARIAGPADWIELRLDLLLPLGTNSVAQWVSASPRPVLLTLRSKTEGGAFRGTVEEAARELGEAMHLPGVVAVDLEPEVEALVAPCPAGVLRIVSTHTFERYLLPAPAGAIRKRAVPIAGQADLDRLNRLVQAPEGGFYVPGGFSVPYGNLAYLRAIGRGGLAPDAFYLLFGAAREDAQVIENQPTLPRLLDELGGDEPRRDGGGLFGLVGRPPAWSPSPAMHNAVFRTRKSASRYLPWTGLDLAEAVKLPVTGLSVTTPYKREAFALATEHDQWSKATGAVNTLVRDWLKGGPWRGHNTDAEALYTLVGESRQPGASACVHGAGGYAAAAVAALRARGFTVRVVARHEARGRSFADERGVPFDGARFVRRDSDHIVVNATQAGADGEAIAAFEQASLSRLHVLDAPYRSAGVGPTGLVVQAQAQGAERVVDGLALLAEQALHQARLFAGQVGQWARDPHDDRVRRVIDLALRPPPSLWLLGIRGAGKTSVGRAVASELGRPFLDLDEEVVRTTGRTPAEWIETDGLAAFRYIESRVVETASARQGVAIATGGGVVESDTNRSHIAQTGFRVWLDVSAAQAASRVASDDTSRPLLFGAADARAEAEEALHRRGHLYRQLSDVVIDADPDLRDVVTDVRTAWLHTTTT